MTRERRGLGDAEKIEKCVENTWEILGLNRAFRQIELCTPPSFDHGESDCCSMKTEFPGSVDAEDCRDASAMMHASQRKKRGSF
jgi:hypothetical protein